jgi:hypothetical protein
MPTSPDILAIYKSWAVKENPRFAVGQALIPSNLPINLTHFEAVKLYIHLSETPEGLSALMSWQDAHKPGTLARVLDFDQTAPQLEVLYLTFANILAKKRK